MPIPGVESAPRVYSEDGARWAPDVTITGPVLLGRNVRLDHGSTVVGPAVIGPGVDLGRNATVMRAVVLPATQVPEGAFLAGGIYANPQATAAFLAATHSGAGSYERGLASPPRCD
ncbi:MAG TPA: hypothetical protein VF729_03400 [Solirubrobacterales bacterium]